MLSFTCLFLPELLLSGDDRSGELLEGPWCSVLILSLPVQLGGAVGEYKLAAANWLCAQSKLSIK